MKIVFIGCVEFSKVLLETVLNNQGDVVGIITKDDTGFNSDYYDLSIVAQYHKIPFIKTKDVNAPVVLEWLRSKNPDVIFCFGWNSLIKREVISIPRLGVIGYHPAKLPQNRGRHPIIWALVLGLKETASTFFFMGEGADDGDILSQEIIAITEEDDAFSLYSKLQEFAKRQVVNLLNGLKNNQYKRISQDHSKANTWRKRTKLDGVIDFRMSSDAIYNLVRGLCKPYVGAHLIYKSDEIKIWKVKRETTSYENFEPGKIINIDSLNKIITIKCGQGNDAILIEEHEFLNLPELGEYI